LGAPLDHRTGIANKAILDVRAGLLVGALIASALSFFSVGISRVR
jgi:hypothetical protein